MSAPRPGSPADAALLEKQAAAFLAEGKFRKARDEAKLLRRLAPDRALPILVQANLGLAREMMAKGQVSEAEQVVAYLATLVPPAQLNSLRLELAGRRGHTEQAVAGALQMLTDPGAALPAVERHRLADLLVLSDGEPVPRNPREQELVAERAIVLEALRAIATQSWQAAQDALRPLPQRSGLSHWKNFLKGLIAFYQGDGSRAARYFAELPSDTVPTRASGIYQLWLERAAALPTGPLPTAGVIDQLAQLCGYGGVGPVIARADQLWRQGKAAESYRAIADKLPGFPSEQPDLAGAFTDFYFKALAQAPQLKRTDLMTAFDRWLCDERPGRTLERALMLRVMAQAAEDGHPESLKEDWHGFIDTYAELHGPNPRLASLVHTHLGFELRQRIPARGASFFRPATVMLDSSGAVVALKRAVELDPFNLRAAIGLCDLYGELKQTREHNRLLDEMVERFPENKEVLLRAGRRCLDRRAYAKGLDYLNRARQLDLLDPVLLRQTVRGLFGQAREQFKKGRPEAARATMDRATSLTIGRPSGLVAAAWCLLARRAALEDAVGDPERAPDLLREAGDSPPSPEALWFYAHMAQVGDTPRGNWDLTVFGEKFLASHLGEASAARALALVEIHGFWSDPKDGQCASWMGTDLVCRYLKAAEQNPFTELDVRRLGEAVGPCHPSFDLSRFVRKILAQDRKSPWCNLFRLAGRPLRIHDRQWQSRLRSIRLEADRRGDTETAQRVTKLLDTPPPLPLPPPPLPLPLPPPKAANPWDLDQADGPYGEEPPRPGNRRPTRTERSGKAPPDLQDPGSLVALMATLAGVPDHALPGLRQELVRQGLPGPLFDILIEAARSGGQLPDSPPFGKVVPKPPPPPDPNQLDLF